MCAGAAGEWATADRTRSSETELLTPYVTAEPPLEIPYVRPTVSHDEPAVEPASRPQRPPPPPQQHLVIVANRLPVNLLWEPTTRTWSLPISSGGLVSALMGVGNVRPLALCACTMKPQKLDALIPCECTAA